jgi:EAL domain-containing protein (putative c-di-GMP-specific phosphodiesterase class I)
VSSIIQLAHGLGLSVVAEGVETAEQRQTLTQLDADACQGFYFARAMPAAAIDALIADGPIRLPTAADADRGSRQNRR